MDKNEEVKISKFLSLILRHKPEEIGLQLNDEGWAQVEDLINNSNKKGFELTIEQLKRIVANSDKKRFTLSEDFSRIRANQGHSIEVDLQLKPEQPPAVLYHGTAKKNLASILEKGILKQSRNHVHLSTSYDVAYTVGQRYGSPVIIEVDALQMHTDGFVFFLSQNNVWLTDFVPIKFIRTAN